MTAAVETRPDLTALEFPDITPSTDSPELVEFKEKVRKVALRHSRNHHCGSIRAEMRELGIEEEKKVKVTVQTNHPFTFTVSIGPSQLAGKTAQEQATVLAGIIGQVNLSVGSNVHAVGLQAITITPETVVSMSREALPKVQRVGDIEVGERDGWRYGSTEGRVLHLFRNLLDEEGDVRRDRYFSAECGKMAGYSQHLPETSDRGTGRYCATCSKPKTSVPRHW
jgi:hypothetical protein